MKLLRATILAAALVLGGGAALAQDFYKGLEAAQAGDFATALKEWQPLAEQGDAGAQNNLGAMYIKGEGVFQDYAEGLKWYRRAAEQGQARAQNNLGAMHGSGKGVPQDHVMAHMWYNIAAANGVEDAPVFRDEIAAEMTSSDISKAQAMARECMSGGYKNCGW
jgi:TPR repeat protein